MRLDSPILSALLGGALAWWLGRVCARWLPRVINGKSAPTLLRENRTVVRGANGVFMASLLATLLLYGLGVFDRYDWRGAGLGFGMALTGPLLVLLVTATFRRRPVTEILAAYALSQKTPITALAGLFGFGVVLFLLSLWHILL